MGREAECQIQWGNEKGQGKIQLEGQELIVRGAMKRRIPFSSLTAVKAQGDSLTFVVHDVAVELHLGSKVAQAWQKAIQAPPPTLAKKLGITADSHVIAWGTIDADELRLALAVASQHKTETDLLVIRASSPLELENGLGICWEKIDTGCPVWVVHPKGKTSPLSETMVREKMRGLGLMDTKVASVSTELTALRFIKRRPEK